MLSTTLSTAEVQYDWTHMSPAYVSDLQKITASNPVFAAELSADLSTYGLSLSQVLSETTTLTTTTAAQPAIVTAASATRTAPAHAHGKGHGHGTGKPVVAPATAGDPPAISSQTLGSLRDDFSGWVGFELTTGADALSVNQLGRWVVAGNSQSHPLKLVDAATGQDVPGASATLNTAGATAGQYDYVSLANPVTLLANHSYFLMSYETQGGDQWYDYEGTVITTTTDVTANNAEYYDTSYHPAYASTGNHSYGPVNFMYTPMAPSQAAITAQTPTNLRNDFTGWAGFEFTTGADELSVSEIGRWVAPNNSQAHTVKLVDAATGADVPGGSVSVNTNGLTSGQYAYVPLASPVTLAANHSYYLMSQETNGGDQWYDYNQTIITTTADLTPDNAEYYDTSYHPAYASTANHSYGPVNFIYSGVPGITPALAAQQTNPSVTLHPSATFSTGTLPPLPVENVADG